MKNLSSDQMKTLVIAVLLMVVGILFCCSLAMGISVLSIVFGFTLLVVGILFLINSIISDKGIFTTFGIMGVIVVSLGILFIVNKLAGIIFAFIPWFLIVFGCAIIIDSLLGRYSRNNNNMTELIIKLVVGIVSIILGICLRLIDGFAEYASLVLGIIMIIYSIYIIFTVFSKSSHN